MGRWLYFLRYPSYEFPQLLDIFFRFRFGNENDSHGLMTFPHSLSSFLVQWEVGGCITWLIFAASFGLLWLGSFFMMDWLGWCVFSWWFSMHCIRLRATRPSLFSKESSAQHVQIAGSRYPCFSPFHRSIIVCLSVCVFMIMCLLSLFLSSCKIRLAAYTGVTSLMVGEWWMILKLLLKNSQ